MEKVEARRILWTTHKNLTIWFENLKVNLQKLGFRTIGPRDNIKISLERLGRILNLDEICLSLDGSNGNRGGRSEVYFCNPHFPIVDKATSKTALTTTMITGSTTCDEALQPHFQFQTNATTVEREKLPNDLVQFIPKIWGKFGSKGRQVWSVTFGMNTKGGMDDEYFQKYMMNSIVPPFPDAEVKPGKRVLIKVDSFSGRMGLDLLAKLRFLGFVLYPGVPNTTVVSQETDRLYGPFETRLRDNLYLVIKSRIQKNIFEFIALPNWTNCVWWERSQVRFCC